MLISLLQTDIAWHDVQANIQKAERLMAQTPHHALYLLPEMWATGFDTRCDAATLARESEPALRWMRHTARCKGCAIAGSLPVAEGGSVFNRFLFAHPDGRLEHYDKRHLFSMGGEQRAFCAGSVRHVVACGGLRFLLQVCYDLRFPVFSRCTGDYDAVIYVASWPARRHLAWHTLLRARSIENQCFALGLNRAGHDPQGNAYGASACYGPMGEELARTQLAECAISLDIRPEDVNNTRNRFDALADSDKFSL